MNLAVLLGQSARSFGDRPAVTWQGRTITYRQLDRQVTALDRWLRAARIGPGTRVALFMDNRPEYLISMLATFRSGATLVPCNARLTADELRFLIGDSGASVVITDPAHAATAGAAAGTARVLVAGRDL